MQDHNLSALGEDPLLVAHRLALPAVLQGTACPAVPGEREEDSRGPDSQPLLCLELPTSPLGMEVCGQPASSLLLTNVALCVPF